MSDPLSGRGPVIAARAMVAADHPLACGAGMQALREGGTAVDAALAAAAVMTVVQPHYSQLGGDLFLLAHDAATGDVRAVNASGSAPAAATAGHYRARGGIPARGPAAVAGPGVVAGWGAAHARWGRLPWRRLFDAAIDYAGAGFPVSTRLSRAIAANLDVLRAHPTAAAQFLTDGEAPRPGALLRQPGLAATLRTIAAGGPRAFYEGEIAERIAAAFRDAGGLLSAADLAATGADLLDPPVTSYRGLTVHEQPPVSQGFIVLSALNLVEPYDLAAMPEPERIHLLAEALKLAFEDRYAHLGDPRHVDVPLARLLSKDHARDRGRLLDRAACRAFAPAQPLTSGDTTYLCAVDADGNAVSLIQSVFAGFGSGFVAGDTGVLFNNRLTGFTLDPGHPNELAPGKRTVHTLNTYLVTRAGRVAIVGGTPGADRQVQTNVQVLTNVIDLGLDARAALDAPRFSLAAGAGLELEDGFSAETRAALTRLGHDLGSLGAWAPYAGRAQLIVVDPETGARMGASDLRGEGQAQGW
jgi:gamma-glutamyltranspeptidase / glutathione hydrolase